MVLSQEEDLDHRLSELYRASRASGCTVWGEEPPLPPCGLKSTWLPLLPAGLQTGEHTAWLQPFLPVPQPLPSLAARTLQSDLGARRALFLEFCYRTVKCRGDSPLSGPQFLTK